MPSTFQPGVFRPGAISIDLQLPATQCLAFKDSRNGLNAALAAGLATIVTPGLYSSGEELSGATMVLPDLRAFRLDALYHYS